MPVFLMPLCFTKKRSQLKVEAKLIQRVWLVTPIADDLKPFIGEEKYSIITACKTPQEQMRALYEFLSGGREIKRKFFESLQSHEPYIVKELMPEK
uniref:CARD domain-containing protein n=1 Tax=Astyanax mexicanus TaxID=7994 RepID=A0A3B1K677_ASTMX